MSHELFELLVVTVIVATDNALLAGLLLPRDGWRDKLWVCGLVAVTLAVGQVIFAMATKQLLHMIWFRYLAIAVLIWMSAAAFRMSMHRGRRPWLIYLKVSALTLVGNIDNLVWLGIQVKGMYLWLVLFSIWTAPVFIVVALAFSNQCAQHRWVVVVGAGMPAWAASTLVVYSPLFPRVELTLELAVRISLTTLILLIGAGTAWIKRPARTT